MTEHPADPLRRAAKLMRDRAALVPPAPWFSAIHDVTTHNGLDVIASSGLTVRAQYVASWHPGVAGAVAEWLELTGERATEELYRDETAYADPDSWFCNRCAEAFGENCTCWDRAFAVARAYLGEEAGRG